MYILGYNKLKQSKIIYRVAYIVLTISTKISRYKPISIYIYICTMTNKYLLSISIKLFFSKWTSFEFNLISALPT